MHASSLENMQRCYERFICGEYLNNHQDITVLDIGGANINGSYTDIFSTARFNYIAADIDESDEVDLVLEDPYHLPFPDNSVDIVISGQAFEHIEYFWILFEEMARILAHDGWMFLIAPSAGPIHRFPVDCYRFYPDAFQALAKYAQLNAIEIRLDERGPWRDLVGVFAKHDDFQKPSYKNWRPLTEKEINRYSVTRQPSNEYVESGSSDLNKIQGGQYYLEVLETLHQELTPSNYFEIGVRNGHSLSLANCASIAIDPDPGIEDGHLENVELYKMPSDHFFEYQFGRDFDKSPIELAFIDGMHLFEFVLRDFINIEARSSSSTTVVIDDVFPNNAIQASERRMSRVWTGDVWKIAVCLQQYRSDLSLSLIDSSPTGMLIIQGLDKNNRVLTDNYNPIIRQFRSLDLLEHQELILKRSQAIDFSLWRSKF